jgi:hypothetical protein
MKFFRTMDLYKAIVLLSAVLLPLGGWWVVRLDETLELCKKAIQQAERPGGFVEEIGTLQKQIEIVALNRASTSESIRDPRGYFDGQLIVSGRGLKTTDYTVQSPKEEPAKGLAGSKQRATDFVVDIAWDRDLKASMEFIYSVIYNCESGATRPGEKAPPSVWRLRDLSLDNVTLGAELAGAKAPVAELRDEWRIKGMSFARREPTK